MVSKVLTGGGQLSGWTRLWGGTVLPAASPGKGAAGSCANDSVSLLSVPCHLLPHVLLSSFCHPLFNANVHAGYVKSVGVTLCWS